jgi:phosphoglucosamine mutase
MKRLFGTDGIRGVAGSFPLDPDTVTRVGAALARDLSARRADRPPRILIGRDTRESGEGLARALAWGAAHGGAACVSAGVIPTPGVAYLARSSGFDAGVMISASHNPYRDNGIKVFAGDGYKLPDQEEVAIEAMVLDGVAALPAAAYSLPDVAAAPDGMVEGYGAFLRASVDRGVTFAGLKVVVDCAHGAASEMGPRALRMLGAEVHALNCAPNGRNINEACGSLHPEGLAGVVRSSGSALGVAFDGDADRCLMVAGDGRLADGDVLILQAALSLKAAGKLAGDVVVTTVMSNLWLERKLAASGIRMLRARVGDKYVLEEMRRAGAVLGGEQSGHIIFADRSTTGDGILTALRLIEILVARGETVEGWLDGVQAYPQVLLNVRVSSRPDLESHPAIGAEAARVRGELGDTGRLVLRYSGTEPLARVMIEATDAGMVNRLSQRLADVIRREIGTD